MPQKVTMNLVAAGPEKMGPSPLATPARGDEAPTIEALLDGAEAILERTISQWRQGAAREVALMISRWSGRAALFRIDPLIRLLADVAGDIEICAGTIGYPEIADAARDVAASLLRVDLGCDADKDARRSPETRMVETCLAILRTRIAEGRHRNEIREDLLAA
jgi:hypothetical protein